MHYRYANIIVSDRGVFQTGLISGSLMVTLNPPLSKG